MSEAAPQLTDLFSTPMPRTLSEVHNDLQTLMSEYKKSAPEHYKEAAQMFPRHPNARTDIQAAEELLAKVKALATPTSTPANLPFPAQASPLEASPVAAAAQATAAEVETAPAPTPAAVPAPISEPEAEPVEPDPIPETPEQDPEADEEGEDRPEDEDEQEEGETEEDEGDQTAAVQSSPPSATVLSEVIWPADTLGNGIISQLAQTLASGDTLQMIVVRRGDELLITVDPKPITGEAAATAIAMQVKGTPAALDTQMVSKLAEFKAGRDVAREEVNYAAQVKAAAEAARKSAEAARKASTTTKKPAAGTQPGTLTLEVAPKNAIVTLTDEKSQTHPCKINGDTSLPAGVYTIAVDAEGFTHHEEKITIRGGAKSKKGIVLKREEVAGLF